MRCGDLLAFGMSPQASCSWCSFVKIAFLRSSARVWWNNDRTNAFECTDGWREIRKNASKNTARDPMDTKNKFPQNYGGAARSQPTKEKILVWPLEIVCVFHSSWLLSLPIYFFSSFFSSFPPSFVFIDSAVSSSFFIFSIIMLWLMSSRSHSLQTLFSFVILPRLCARVRACVCGPSQETFTNSPERKEKRNRTEVRWQRSAAA